MSFRIHLAAFVCALLCPVFAIASDSILLSMPEPPEGMSVTKTALRVEDEVVGYHVQVADGEGVSKVLVQIETSFDRTERAARVAAVKGYVNGIANGLKGAGFELKANKVPQLKTAKFNKPLVVDMTFEKSDATQLFIRQFIFFTQHGYNVQVLANSESELAKLASWAQHIKPFEQVRELAKNPQEAETVER